MSVTTKAVVKIHDMRPDMLEFAINKAFFATEAFDDTQRVATYLKEQLEETYETAWHVCVGRNFSAFVTHEQSHYAYFYIGQTGFLVYKTP